MRVAPPETNASCALPRCVRSFYRPDRSSGAGSAERMGARFRRRQSPIFRKRGGLGPIAIAAVFVVAAIIALAALELTGNGFLGLFDG
ncbi:hypothetical protein [Marinicauda salina]|uniref:hypothetical protein n=1 Tax=Marinicauda salina TaxID=2135793 RepID=UPI001304A437|nr:hypothetical protein [Marinicauda salina]